MLSRLTTKAEAEERTKSQNVFHVSRFALLSLARDEIPIDSRKARSSSTSLAAEKRNRSSLVDSQGDPVVQQPHGKKNFETPMALNHTDAHRCEMWFV